MCTPAQKDGDTTTCDTTGNLNLCQLCPKSPTYWANTPAGPALTPHAPLQPQTLPDRGVVFNWQHGCTALKTPQPCTICRKPVHVLNPGRKACHKVCAERWLNEHPTQRAERLTP